MITKITATLVKVGMDTDPQNFITSIPTRPSTSQERTRKTSPNFSLPRLFLWVLKIKTSNRTHSNYLQTRQLKPSLLKLQKRPCKLKLPVVRQTPQLSAVSKCSPVSKSKAKAILLWQRNPCKLILLSSRTASPRSSVLHRIKLWMLSLPSSRT